MSVQYVGTDYNITKYIYKRYTKHKIRLNRRKLWVHARLEVYQDQLHVSQKNIYFYLNFVNAPNKNCRT